MSKTIELAKHLEKLHINNMYKSDFYWTWDKNRRGAGGHLHRGRRCGICGSATRAPHL